MKADEYKKIRKQLGTQQEVSELLGVTRQLIGMRENGVREITKEAELAIRQLAEI